jgi:arylsulfatase A-like enzyme
MALNLDLAPTLLEAASAPIPGYLQGRSLLPLCRNPAKVPWRHDFLCEHLFQHPKIPQSDGVRTRVWKYLRYFEQDPPYEELYDLSADPQETQNLADKPQHRARLQQLRRRRDTLVAAASRGAPD